MGCMAPDGSRMGRVGLRDRVRGGAKGPHRAGRRAPASLRPMRQDPSARVGPPPLTIGRRAVLRRGRKSLPRRRTPHACGWCHRRAGCLRNFNKGHNERNVGMTRRRFGVHAAAAAGQGGVARRGAPQPPRRHARGWIVERPAPRRLRYGRGKVNACLSGRSPRAAAWCRHTVTAKASTPQVGMAQGARLTCGLLASREARIAIQMPPHTGFASCSVAVCRWWCRGPTPPRPSCRSAR